MEDVDDESMVPEPNKLKKKLMESTVLDSFTRLTSDLEKIRVDAGAVLLRHLNKTNEDAVKRESEHNYALNRLVRGVGSSRKSAKSGFYSVLVGFLTNSSLVTTENVLAVAKKHLSTGGSNSKSENADISMGQILVCGALMHSGKYLNSTVDEQKEVLELLFTAGKRKSYLSLAAYCFIYEILDKITEDQFKTLWDVIKPEVSKPWAEQTLDTIYLLCLLRDKFPAVVKGKFIKKILEVPDIIHEDSCKELCEILMNIPWVVSLKHPVYQYISEKISKSSFITNWCSEMDSQLLKPNRNKHLVAILFLTSIFDNITDSSLIPNCLTTQFIILTLTTFRNKRPRDIDLEFVQGIETLFKSLIKSLQNDSVSTKTKISVVKRLLFYPGTFIFEKQTGSKLIQQITAGLNADGVKKLAKLYKEVVSAQKPRQIDEDQTETWINLDRIYAANLIIKLLGHGTVQTETEWRLEQIQFLIKLGLFKQSPEYGIGVELSAELKDCFYRSLDQRLPKLEDLRNLLSSLVHFVNDSLFVTKTHELRTPLTETGLEHWNQMMKLVGKLEKHPGTHNYAIVFHTLLLQMGLQLFKDPEMAENALTELSACYSKLKAEKKEKSADDEPQWVEVVVDLFLNLLSYNSHLLRHTIGCVFPYLCPRLTLTAIRQILDVLDPKNEDNPLTKSKPDEEESSDESDEEKSGDDEESDTSSVSELSETEVNETDNDKLRMAVRAALHKNGYQTDDESEDMEKLNEEDGMKLDEALAGAFKLVKKKNQKGRNSKQTNTDRTLTHFRVRVLDLIEMYIDSEPSMLQSLEIASLLLQTLEFSIRDIHQKPLEQRLRHCLKRITSLKKFSSISDVTEDTLLEHLSNFIEKGSKSAFIYQDMGGIIAECCLFVIKCSQIIDTDKKKSKKIIKLFQDSLKTYFENRDCLLPLVLFKTTIQVSWNGNWKLVPLLVQFAFDPTIRQFRKSQALELLRLFYANNRFRNLNLDHFKQKIAPIEQELSEKSIEVLKYMTENTVKSKVKEKFFYLLLSLLIIVKKVNASDRMDWTTIGESIRNYRSRVTLARDAKMAFNKLCRTLGISNLVKMQPNLPNPKTESSEDDETVDLDDKTRKRKKIKKDSQKLKKEARLLRLKVSSEGLTEDIAFSNISMSNIHEPEENDEEQTQNGDGTNGIEEPREKKSKKELIMNGHDEIPPKKRKKIK